MPDFRGLFVGVDSVIREGRKMTLAKSFHISEQCFNDRVGAAPLSGATSRRVVHFLALPCQSMTGGVRVSFKIGTG